MEPLKNMFSTSLLKKVGGIAEANIKGFKPGIFLKGVLAKDWELLELKERVRRISTVLHEQMSGDYTKDIKQLLKLTEALRSDKGSDNAFAYIFLPDYIEQYGTGHFEESFAAMEVITTLISCEFAIRPFIMADMDAALKVMKGWCSHAHPSVRRLASEGCRPRLPWAMALPALKKDPSLILPILEQLKNDPSEFVRKSVANNLNDITKDNPDVALRIAKKWKGHSRNTDWIIKHGCRTLLKKANNDALQLFGLDSSVACSVADFKLRSKKISIGDHLHFAFTVVNEEQNEIVLRIEYIISYAKANNKQSRKIFKITENTYMPGNPISFNRKQSFADMTTRKHYPGRHTISIVVNGVEKAMVAFEVKEK